MERGEGTGPRVLPLKIPCLKEGASPPSCGFSHRRAFAQPQDGPGAGDSQQAHCPGLDTQECWQIRELSLMLGGGGSRPTCPGQAQPPVAVTLAHFPWDPALEIGQPACGSCLSLYSRSFRFCLKTETKVPFPRGAVVGSVRWCVLAPVNSGCRHCYVVCLRGLPPLCVGDTEHPTPSCLAPVLPCSG